MLLQHDHTKQELKLSCRGISQQTTTSAEQQTKFQKVWDEKRQEPASCCLLAVGIREKIFIFLFLFFIYFLFIFFFIFGIHHFFFSIFF